MFPSCRLGGVGVKALGNDGCIVNAQGLPFLLADLEVHSRPGTTMAESCASCALGTWSEYSGPVLSSRTWHSPGPASQPLNGLLTDPRGSDKGDTG